MRTDCGGLHDIYVAEVAVVRGEGKIVVVTVCRHCNTVTFHEKVVAKPADDVVLLKENAKEQK